MNALREAIRSLFSSTGQLAIFSADSARRVPAAMRYAHIVLGHCAEVAVRTGPVLLFISFFVGAQVALEGYYAFKDLGAQSLLGIFTSIGNTRDIIPLVTSTAVAAQMGCSFVAELGAMRISQEIDALETMAIPSITYLVTTRMLAIVLMTPFLHVIALGCAYFASFLIATKSPGDVNAADYFDFFWRFLPLLDLLYSVLKAFIFGILIGFVSTYYGYTVRGGPAEVGVAVGKSMNVIIGSQIVISLVMSQITYGLGNDTISF